MVIKHLLTGMILQVGAETFEPAWDPTRFPFINFWAYDPYLEKGSQPSFFSKGVFEVQKGQLYMGQWPVIYIYMGMDYFNNFTSYEISGSRH